MSGTRERVRGVAVERSLARHRRLLERTVLVSGFTLLSRVLGFVREVGMAMVFGDRSAVCDAFFTAWRVPNLMRRLFGEGALSTSLQAVLIETDQEAGEAEGRRLFVRTAFLAAALLTVVTLGGMLLVASLPDRMPGTGWPWLGADPAPVRDLCVRLLPYVLLVCVTALAGGALQVRGHFATPSAAPVLMNVGWIAALFGVATAYAGADRGAFGVQWEMARWLAWGVLAAGVLQLALLLPALRAHGLLPRHGDLWTRAPQLRSRVLRVLSTSLPLAVGAAVYQVNVLLDGLMAEGLLRDGGPSALYYANRVQQFPLALVATAATSAVFPALKARAHAGDRQETARLHTRAQLGILFLALPASVGLWALARPVSTLLFEHGSYGPEGTLRIAAGLRMLAMALVPAGAAGLLGRTFIALGDPHTPVRVAAVFLFVNAALNVALVRVFGMDVEGLTLATAITSWATLATLGILLRRRLPRALSPTTLLRRVFAIALAALACLLAALLVQRVAWVAAAPSRAVLGGIAAGAAAFFATARGLGLPEWRELTLRLGRSRPPEDGGPDSSGPPSP